MTIQNDQPQPSNLTYTGQHLIIDLWSYEALDKIEPLEQIMRECIEVCQATLLHIHLHPFNQHEGISGVAVLAESHISVHTWPEFNYAAFDVFMCGHSNPQDALPILERHFKPYKLQTQLYQRGENHTKLG